MPQKASNSTIGQTPHVKIASATLPPDVRGDVKGELVISINSFHWQYRRPPQQVQARLRWWGGTVDTVVPFHSTRGAGAAFPITCGPRYLSRYLKDMGSLVVEVEECPTGRTVGTISIAVSQLDVGKPIEAKVPCHGAHEQLLATADVSMRIHYTQMLSSFEINEHLASTDKQLPLYPVPGAQGARGQQQQVATVQGRKASLPAPPAGKENPAAADADSSLDRGAGGEKATDQQKLTAGRAADSSAVAAVPATVKAPAADSTPQLQQHNLAIVAVPAEAAAGAKPDPLLDIIWKAEQLKVAMEQAASRGISVGLPGGVVGPPNIRLGPQLVPQQQPYMQTLLPGLQQEHVQTPWLHGAPAAGLLAAAPSAAPVAPSAVALEAVRACLYGPAAAAASSLALPPPGIAATATAPHSGASTAHLRSGTPAQQHLSPLAAALLQMPTAAHHYDATSDADDGGSNSSGTVGDSSQVTELEDLEELEAVLLQELFRVAKSPRPSPVKKRKPELQQHQQQGDQQDNSQMAPAAAPEPGAAEAAASAGAQPTRPLMDPALPADQPVEQVKQSAGSVTKATAAETAVSCPSGPQLLVVLSAVEGVTTSAGLPPAVLTAVIKSAGQNSVIDITQLPLTQHSSISAAEGVNAVVTGPSCLSSPTLATDKPCLAVELWYGKPANPAAAAAGTATGELLGIVKVPLETASVATTAAAGIDFPGLASGTYPVYDVLRGRYAGSVKLRVSLAADSEPHPDEVVPAATAEETAADTAGAVLAVRHVIEVTLHSVSALPDAQQLELGSQPVPESRFLKYSFPGEEPLFTQEVDVIAAPVFSAHAQHTVLLPPGTTVAECLLAGEGDEAECLMFELYNKWQDDTDTLLASGALPLHQVLALSQIDHPGTSESSTSMRTFLVQLQLAAETGEAAVQPPEQAVLLQVTISYSASNCYDLEEDEGEHVDHWTNPAVSEAEGHDAPQVHQEPGPAAAPAAAIGGQRASDGSHQGQQQHAAGMSQNASAAGAWPVHADAAGTIPQQQARLVQQELSDSGVSGTTAGEQASRDKQLEHGSDDIELQDISETDEEEHDTGVQAAAAAARLQQLAHIHAEPATAHQQCEQLSSEPQQEQLEYQAAGVAAVPKQQQQQQQALTAEVCVEIIRACGLQAAVVEAERCLGGSSSLLGRARHLGPHPYVTMDLLPFTTSSSKSVASIKTPFQAQTFCPQFHYKQIIPLTLDSSTMTAVATHDSIIELWHHCPRSQAVAAALSRGHSSSFVMSGQQQVLLGSARLPLQGLLVKPQGIRCWVVLKSPQGVAVGAVQVAVYFTHIGGHAAQYCSAADCPINKFPQLLQSLPQQPASQLAPLVTCPPPGFLSQLAAVSVHIQELLLPGGDDLVLERPRIANYVATYKLPGREREESTHSKANSSQRSNSSLLAQSWHVDWQYCGRHWVTADWRLGKALICYPLVITVAKHESSRRGSSSGGGRAEQQQQVMVPLGSVEVDLSPLLHVRPGAQRPSCRWLSGVYAVVHPMAKNLGDMRVKLKVLLELQPAEAPAIEAMKGTAPHWEISGPLAAVTAPTPQLAAAATAAAVSEPSQAELGSSHRQQQQQMLGPDEDVDRAQQQQDSAADHHQQRQRQPPDSNPATMHCASQVLAVTAHLDSIADSAARQTSFSVSPSEDISAVAAKQVNADVAAAAEARAAGADALAAAAAELDAIMPAARTRLRAEVSHVSVPASTAVSRSISPVTVPAQQQRAMVALPSAAVPGHQQQQLKESEVSSALTIPNQLQQQQGLNDVRVCIEAALNLELPPLAPDTTACLYVQYEWQETHSVITTPLVAAAVGPLGHTASAKWFHCVHLPLAVGATVTAAAEAADGYSPEPLVLQVWLRPLEASASAVLPPLYAGVAASPAAGDVLLGCAVLDLAALQFLGNIEGWYNICDHQQQMKGQTKVSLTPVQQHTAIRPSSTPEHRQLLVEGPGSTLLAAADAFVSLDTATNSTTSNSSVDHARGVVHASYAASEGIEDRTASYPAASHKAATKQHQKEYQPGLQLEHDSLDAIEGARSDPASVAELQADLPLLQTSAEPHQGWQLPEYARQSDTDSVAGTDQLLESLRANLKELDEISAALAERVKSSDTVVMQEEGSRDTLQPSLQQQDQQQQHKASASLDRHQQQQDYKQQQQQQQVYLQLPGATQAHQQVEQQQQHQQARHKAQVNITTAPPTADTAVTAAMSQPAAAAGSSAAGAAAAARAASLHHVQTLSDDEDYFVGGAAVTDSDTDTEELMGRVDWSMAQNSDDYEGPPGPVAQSSAPAARQPPPAAAAAAAGDSITNFIPEPLNKEDWMFDFSRPSGTTAAAAAAGSSSSKGPVNPAQLSQNDAAAQQAAAAERLARLDAVNAAAAGARAAAAERAAAHAAAALSAEMHITVHAGQQHRGEAGHGAGASSNAVWDHLAAVEEEEERQQQQQRRQQQAHESRDLPEDLHERLDLLLAGFQAAVNPQPPNRTAQSAAATAGPAAADRALQSLQFSDGDDDGDFLPAERVVHCAGVDRGASAVGFANCLPPIQDDFVLEYSDGPRRSAAAALAHTPAAAVQAALAGATVQSSPAAAAMWDREDDDIVDGSLFVAAERVELGAGSGRRVRFSNSLPPVQDNVDLQFSDGPPRVASSSRTSSSQQQQQVKPLPAAAAQLPPAGAVVGHPGMSPAAAAAAAAAVEAAAAQEEEAAPGGSSVRSVGMVPVLGSYSPAAMDDMFSITKRPRIGSSSSGRVKHAGVPPVSQPPAGVPGIIQQRAGIV